MIDAFTFVREFSMRLSSLACCPALLIRSARLRPSRALFRSTPLAFCRRVLNTPLDPADSDKLTDAWQEIYFVLRTSVESVGVQLLRLSHVPAARRFWRGHTYHGSDHKYNKPLLSTTTITVYQPWYDSNVVVYIEHGYTSTLQSLTRNNS